MTEQWYTQITREEAIRIFNCFTKVDIILPGFNDGDENEWQLVYDGKPENAEERCFLVSYKYKGFREDLYPEERKYMYDKLRR